MDIRGLPSMGNKLENDSEGADPFAYNFEDCQELGVYPPGFDSATMQVDLSEIEEK